MNKIAILITGVFIFLACCVVIFIVSLENNEPARITEARNMVSEVLEDEAMKKTKDSEAYFLTKISMNLHTRDYKNGIIIFYTDTEVWYIKDTNICCLNGRTKQLTPSIDYCKDINYLNVKNILQ
ncbi:MAG: hypothetical protein KAT66_00805 [Candidatus Lokiarchaeota archaeon]|nr:hypothetical protein [Candidatus Lokiarchaeota archaeon]